MSSPLDAPLLVVVGPTGSGKTALACRLAELGGGEVVSADSVQVYRHFDIGSAKPSAAERARAPHHLIDIAEPTACLEAAQWAQRAGQVMRELSSRGVRPIVCGGSFLWVRSLLYGLADAPSADPVRRAAHQALVERLGRAALHERLTLVDPGSAARLHPNDFVRVSRALEVFELTGRPLSELQAEHGFRTPLYRARLVGIQQRPEDLDERLRLRCRTMFAAGWVEEVSHLLESGYATSRPMGAVGYRQISDALLHDEAGAASLEELEQRVLRTTRIFARRQRTWLRDQPIAWLTPEQAADDAQLETLLCQE